MVTVLRVNFSFKIKVFFEYFLNFKKKLLKKTSRNPFQNRHRAAYAHVARPGEECDPQGFHTFLDRHRKNSIKFADFLPFKLNKN